MVAFLQTRESTRPVDPWHTVSIEDTVRRLTTDLSSGLTSAEVALRYARYGPNAIVAGKQRSLLSIFVHQFQSLVVALLMAATGVALMLGEHVEAGAILIVVVLNAVIGFATEWKAATALNALRSEAVTVAHVRRDGVVRQIPALELVPGDLVELTAGGRVPADGRLVEHMRLQVEEAALTGESLPVSKNTEPLPERDTPLGDRVNMVHMGTVVADGRGRFIVTATGMQTEMGVIGALVADADMRRTPLEDKLAHLGRVLLVLVIALSAVIVLAGWLRGNEFLY